MGRKTATCYILNHGRVLLQKKSIGLFGENKWNAPGGKMLANESPEDGAIREFYEETEIRIENLEMIGKIYFYVNNTIDQELHIFRTENYTGTGKNGREGILEWFDFDRIPFEDMWEDASKWLPILLEGKRFSGKFYYSTDYKNLIDFQLSNDINW
ncbi:MAG: 8-oxo-dGTP diphosphatase [Candidatus Micrarchaeaceae archaeon]|jgi:8-oxo-dGTP pyrophosphatase MutT (NUDIX family)